MNIPAIFDNILDGLQAILLSILIKLGPFAVALMPALFTGYAVYHTFALVAGSKLALFFAIIVSLAVETVGIVATHTTIDLYNGWRSKYIDGFKVALMALLVPFYVAGVAGTVWYAGDAFEPLVRALGVASPFLTCVVYIAVALARDLANIKQAQSRDSQHERDDVLADRQFERELTRRKLELEQERKLRELELSAKVQIEQSNRASTEPVELARAGIECEDCGRSNFETVQGLNAHRRFCKGVKVNGHIKEAL